MKRVSICVFLAVSLAVAALGQPVKPIPVYPGAKLVIEKEEGIEPECCRFFTTDAFEKVISFYEKQLKTKPMDTKALVAAYPAMKQQIQMLEQQMPPTVKLRGFVVGEVTMNGEKAPMVFELIGSPQGVRFSISEDALTATDVRFAKEWREKTGKLTQEEVAQKNAGAQQAEDEKEMKEREERRKKEEPEYRAKMTAELTKFLKQNKTDLASGLRCELIRLEEGESSSWYAFYFESKDDFKKVYDFYALRGEAGPISNENGRLSGWSIHETVCTWRNAEFQTGSSYRIEVREVSMTKESPRKTYVAVSVYSSDISDRMRQIEQEYRSRW